MKKTAFLSILLCLCMVASLVLVPAPQAAAAVDTSKLDGVYEASFSGQVMYVLTFNNGKLTVEDKNMGTLTGEYTYTVVDGIPVVDGGKFLFSKDMGGNYTVQPEGFRFALTMTKIAELGGGAEESKNTINVTTTDNNTWVDEFTFTATKAGKYTFTIPAGLGIGNAKEMDETPFSATIYIDYVLDKDGGEFTVTLGENESIRFYIGSETKGDWVITWEMETPVISGTIDVTVTDNNTWIDAYTFTAPVAGDYTFTIPAGLGIANADEMDGPNPYNGTVYIDFVTDNDGGKFTLTLDEGESVRFYVGAQVKGSWTIEWTTAKEEEKPQGNVAVLGENTITITDAIINEGGVAYTFVVEVAGNYTFTLGDLRILIVDASGMTINANQANLVPGTYTLRIIMNDTITAGDYTLTITTDAVIGGNNVLVMGENTIEYGNEHLVNGMDFTFEVTESGTYCFEGGLWATVKDANGMMVGRNQVLLAPGTYTVSVYNPNETAGTFTMTIVMKTEEQLEQEAIDNVIALIEAIGEVTADSQDAIVTARDFYNALSDESKAKVTNLSVLEAAEEAFAALTPDEPGTDEPGNDEPTTPPTTQPTTPATQPNGNDGDDNNGSPVVIIVIVVVVAVVVVAAILFSKKRKA